MKHLCTALLFTGMLCLASEQLSAQTWAWGKNSSTPTLTTQTGHCHATDRWGNNFVAGSSLRGMFDVDNTTHFGPFSLPSPDRFTSFLVKYNTGGTALWMKQMKAIDYMKVATDNDGNVFITGAFIKSVTIGSLTVYGVDTAVPSNINILVAKLDGTGNVLWMRVAGGPGNSQNYPWGIATDNAGNVVVTGTYNTKITFGATTLDTLPSIYGGQYDCFVAKYDAGGNVSWANAIKGISDESLYGITTDPSGNVIAAGESHSDTIIAGTTQAIKTTPGYQMFIVKYNSAGALSWLKTATGNVSSQGGVHVRAKAVAADESGNIYITGSTNAGTTNFGGYLLGNPSQWGQFMYAKYNAGGTCLWAKVTAFGSTCSAALGRGIVTVKSDHVFIMGFTDSHHPHPFGAGIIQPFSEFLIKADTAGNATMIECKSETVDWLTLSADVAGNAYISGTQVEDCTFGPSSLTFTGLSNMFLAKYGSYTIPYLNVAEHSVASDVRIYPNPANDELLIEAGDQIGHVVIGNMLGQVKTYSDYNGTKANIDITDLAPGMYYVRVNNGRSMTFVKQ